MAPKSSIACVLFSGGIDSCVVATMLGRSKMKVYLLFMDIGEPNADVSVRSQANYFRYALGMDVELVTFPFTGIFDHLRTPDTYKIPGYRMIMQTTALAYADKLGIPVVYTGEAFAAFGQNSAADPEGKAIARMLGDANSESSTDARHSVVQTYGYLYHPGDKWCDSIAFIDPLYLHDKQNRVALGEALGAPLHLTHTCKNTQCHVPRFPYWKMPPLTDAQREDPANIQMALVESSYYLELCEQPQPYVQLAHCGKSSCLFCQQRKFAFYRSAQGDPTFYQTNEPISEEFWEIFAKGSTNDLPVPSDDDAEEEGSEE